MPTSDGQGDPEEPGAAEQTTPGAGARDEGTTGAVVETVECPNCGRRFVGDYCPDCGQEADPSVSATGVVGGFFRELVDVEQGFWPTLVGLTLRPGNTLQQYLRGVRKGLASPGRYLLAVVLITYGVERLLVWTGAESPDSGSSPEGQGAAKALDVAYARLDVIFEGQARLVLLVLVIGPLAALLYRLFDEQFDRWAEALAVGSFLVAHAIMLSWVPDVAYQLPASLYAGRALKGPTFVSVAIYFGYIGFASYRCFGPGWWPAVKGTFAGAWSIVEMFSVLFIGATGYAAWLFWAHPDRYPPSGSPEEDALMLLLVGLLCLLPLLLHAGVEAYYRLR